MCLLERKFGEIRKYLDIASYISVCMEETVEYENFECSLDVPHIYDDYYVYGIGLANEIFPNRRNPDEMSFQPCLEVILCKKPREYEEIVR